MKNDNLPITKWCGLEITAPLLRPSEVCARTGLSRATIYNMMKAGTFPPYVKLGKRASALPVAWLEKHLEQLPLIDNPNPIIMGGK